jgi:hypothetical protein
MFKAGKSKATLARFFEKWLQLKKNGVPPSQPIESAFVRMFSFHGAHDLAQAIYLEMRREGLDMDVGSYAQVARLANTEKSKKFWAEEVKKLGLENDVKGAAPIKRVM